jgi:hypothetical protein
MIITFYFHDGSAEQSLLRTIKEGVYFDLIREPINRRKQGYTTPYSARIGGAGPHPTAIDIGLSWTLYAATQCNPTKSAFWLI